MSGAIIAAIIGGLFGGGGLVALGRLILDRRKGRADEAQVITSAAAQYVEIMREEMQRLQERMENVEKRLQSTQRSARSLSRWSQRAYQELVSLGSDIEAPPDIEHLGENEE